jgi:hypothetical protein
MTKLLITPVTLKANLFAAAVALACGDTLPVVLISTLFGFIEPDAGSVRQAMPPGDERRLAEPQSRDRR